MILLLQYNKLCVEHNSILLTCFMKYIYAMIVCLAVAYYAMIGVCFRL